MPLESEIERIGTEEGQFLLQNFQKLHSQPFADLFRNTDADPEEIFIIEHLLLFDPRRRLTTAQLLTNPYFQELL